MSQLSAMTPTHAMFLQAMMARGMLNAKEVKELHKSCCEKFEVPFGDTEEERRSHLVELIHLINANIQAFHLEIKKGVSEDDGTNFYCLINNVENNITRLASDYTTTELEFFKKLVEKIVESDGMVGSVAALNITSSENLERKLSKADAQDLLERLEQDRWIEQKDGSVSLSVRCTLELDQYIRQVYQESVKVCNVCKQLCLKGQTCDECGVKIHRHCAARFFQQQAEPRCPDSECRAPWRHEIPGLRDLSNQENPPATQRTSKRRTQKHPVDKDT